MLQFPVSVVMWRMYRHRPPQHHNFRADGQDYHTLNDNTLNYNTLNDNTLNDNTLNAYTLNDNTLNNNTLNTSTTPANIHTFIAFTKLKKFLLGRRRQTKIGAAPTRQEQQHVVFLKVHKAASSTLQNIFLRYALGKDLNILLFTKTCTQGEKKSIINPKKVIPPPSGSTYDIFCHHMIFNLTDISRYFPSDVVYIGVVREPFHQFLSAFAFYGRWDMFQIGPAKEANPENPVEEFLNNTEFYNKEHPVNIHRDKINNRMSVDFGFPLDDFENSKRNETLIKSFLDHLDRTFSLVLIAELFEESLVLMRRMLGWTTKDIIYIDKNTMKSKGGYRKEYPAYVHDKFKAFAAPDIALYEHFYNVLQTKLSQQPPDFWEEVRVVKTMKTHVYRMCHLLIVKNSTEHSAFFSSTKVTSEFSLSLEECWWIAYGEVTLSRKARERQRERRKATRH